MENNNDEKIYYPAQSVIDNANIKEYDKMYKYSIENPEKFWEEQAGHLDGTKNGIMSLTKAILPFINGLKEVKPILY
jgi:acetyl-CoA synthetase